MASRTAGVYYCPSNWHFKAEEAGYLLRDFGAGVLIVQPDLLSTIASAVPAGVTVLVVDGSEAVRTSRATTSVGCEWPEAGNQRLVPWPG